MSVKLTKVQTELLGMLVRGPRYGFTDMRSINALTRKGLVRKAKTKNEYGQPAYDWVITAKGRTHALSAAQGTGK